MKSKVRNIIATMLVIVITIAGFIPPGIQIVKAEGINTTVINSNTIWKYLDDNTDPAAGTMLYEYTSGSIRNQWTFPENYPVEMQGASSNMGFDDSSWNEADGPFGFKVDTVPYLDVKTTLTADTDGTNSNGIRVPAYFFRTTFEVENPEDFNSIYYKLQFNDAAVIYLNGIEIGSHNIPDRGYGKNLDYGAVTVSNPYLEEENTVATSMKDMFLQDMLREGTNVLSVELHQESAGSSDIYLNFIDFTLRTEEIEKEYVDLKALTVAPGSDESELRFAWYSSNSEVGKIKLYEGEKEINTTKGTSESIEGGLYSNKVTVNGLKGNTNYSYRVGNGDTWSEKYTITTGKASSFSFFLVGDPQIGTTNLKGDTAGWNNTVQEALKKFSDVRFMVSAGDQVNTATNESEYDGYLSPTGLTGLPVAQTVGNHDVSVNYLNHFNLANLDNTLGNTSAGGDYWFRYGSTLFMMINSNNKSTSEHKQFLEQVIAKNSDAKWKIVTFHHSIYSVASHAFDTDVLERRKNWVPVFDKLGIDIVFMGHDHSYARTYQMYNNTPVKNVTMKDGAAINPKGTVYITANSASGSKYYGPAQQEYYYAANLSQLNTPAISKIDMTDNRFTIKTYRVDTMEITDEYSIVKETKVSKIKLNKTSIKLNVKETFKIKPTITPSDASNKKVTYKSSNPGIISVNNSGKITAKKTGKAKVTVTAKDGSGVKSTISVTVRAAAAKNVKAVKQSESSVEITWKKASNVTGYKIFRSGKGKKGVVKISTVKGAGKVSYVDKNLKKGKTYYYKIRTYKTIKGKKIYSKYSNVTRVKL